VPRCRTWWLLCLLVPLLARGAEDIVIQVRPGQSIQDIASRYMGDPSLWPAVLEHNDLQSPEQIVPWMQLRIPATGLTMAALAIQRAETQLARAIQAGGRVFARNVLDESSAKVEQARGAFRAHDYALARQLAEASLQLSQQAGRAAASVSTSGIQAIVENLSGTVETQRPDDISWRRAERLTRLVEGERVRTRSASHADILFRDGSRIRVNANSLAVIREMRRDETQQRNRTSVALMRGDVLASLAELRETNQFDLELPNVRTYVESRSFWVNRGPEETTRLAVYEGRITVEAVGGVVVVAENQGTTIRPQQPPEQPRQLLRAPLSLSPDDGATVRNRAPALRWSAVPGATTYRIVVAQDPAFNRVVRIIPDHRDRRYTPERLDRGVYYWRVSAVDGYGFPGPPGTSRSLVLQLDRLPPFLAVMSPLEPVTLARGDSIVFSGEIEEGSTLRLNGRPVRGYEGDRFRCVAALTTGENRFTFVARDSSGNETVATRTVIRRYAAPDVEVLGSVNGDVTVTTNLPVFMVSGRAEPTSRVILWRVDGGRAVDSTLAAVRPDGSFAQAVTLGGPSRVPPGEPAAHEYLVEAIDPAGARSHRRLVIVRDEEPPKLVFDEPSAIVTREDTLVLCGATEGGATLSVNDRPARVTDGRFSLHLALRVGRNTFVLRARDAAGNERVAHVTAICDWAPPRIIERSISPASVTGGETVTVVVRADDAAGLARAARFRVAGPNGFAHEGTLAAERSDRPYIGRFVVPAGVRGRLRLEWVRITDLAGNGG